MIVNVRVSRLILNRFELRRGKYAPAFNSCYYIKAQSPRKYMVNAQGAVGVNIEVFAPKGV